MRYENAELLSYQTKKAVKSAAERHKRYDKDNNKKGNLEGRKALARGARQRPKNVED